jgi:hypothetical protein
VGQVALVLLTAMATATSVWATDFNVANNGVDTATCGPPASPCRSINQAISLASDGDKVLVGPGIYSFRTEPDPGDGSLILVDKQVSIRSTRGAAATVIEGCPGFNGICLEKTEDVHTPTCVPHAVVVKITDDNASFGTHSDFGFTILNRQG